jgi:hypothetical protein
LVGGIIKTLFLKLWGLFNGQYYKPGKMRAFVSAFMTGLDKFWPSRMVFLFQNRVLLEKEFGLYAVMCMYNFSGAVSNTVNGFYLVRVAAGFSSF